MPSIADGTLVELLSPTVLTACHFLETEAIERVDDHPASLQQKDTPELKECPECERLDDLLMECMNGAETARCQAVLDEIRSHLTAAPSRCGKLA